MKRNPKSKNHPKFYNGEPNCQRGDFHLQNDFEAPTTVAHVSAELTTICSDVYRRIGSREMSPAQGAGMTFPLYDSNGNRVGFAKFEAGK